MREGVISGYMAVEWDRTRVMLSVRSSANRELLYLQLDFGGRVTQESAKNFQIEFADKQVMQFGRIENGAYTLDFRAPFSAVQAFAVALASITQRLKWAARIKGVHRSICSELSACVVEDGAGVGSAARGGRGLGLLGWAVLAALQIFWSRTFALICRFVLSRRLSVSESI